jgi:hypothetical protein
VTCECGCGFEGEDDVTQFCIEEAALITLDAFQNAQLERDEADKPADTPGTITDPVMVEAMARAKALHAHEFGVQVR